jgi:hypothetical protein
MINSFNTAARVLGSCVAIAATLGLLYLISMVLSFASNWCMNMLFKLWTFVSGNWLAVIIIVVLVALGTIIFDVCYNSLKGKKGTSTGK